MTFSESIVQDALVMNFEGRIVEGDMNRMVAFVKGLNKRYGKFPKSLVVLNSPGGSVIEASQIAELISKSQQAVLVINSCASACFLMFAASPTKMIAPGAFIGVHSASIDDGETTLSQAVSVIMARDLRRYGVPANVIGQLITTNPDDMYQLSATDLQAMRFVNLKPTEIRPAAETKNR